MILSNFGCLLFYGCGTALALIAALLCAKPASQIPDEIKRLGHDFKVQTNLRAGFEGGEKA